MGYYTKWEGKIYADKDASEPLTGEPLSDAIRDIAFTNKTFDDGWLGIFVPPRDDQYVGTVALHPDDPDSDAEIWEQQEPCKYNPVDAITKWSKKHEYKFFVEGNGEEQGDITKTWICGGVVKEQEVRIVWTEEPTF